MKEYILEGKNIVRTFKEGSGEARVLKGVSVEVKKGEFVAIMGRSGAGKSTLLYQLSLLDVPTSGEVVIDGIHTTKLSQDEMTKIRLRKLGYVFQDYSLVPELTAVENVMVPLLMQGVSEAAAFSKAEKALTQVLLGERLSNTPSKLSGGEQQRVSIARAIVHEPAILFADEPTANLDSQASELVISTFEQLNKERGLTVVMVTHEEDFGKRADRIIRLADGVILP